MRYGSLDAETSPLIAAFTGGTASLGVMQAETSPLIAAFTGGTAGDIVNLSLDYSKPESLIGDPL